MAEAGASEKLIGGETLVARVRLAVIAVGTALFFYGDTASGDLPGAQAVVLALAWLYGLALAILQPQRFLSPLPLSWASTALDLVFSCVWIAVTGGFESRWYDLYFLGLAACAFRFGLVETAAVGVWYAASYAVLLAMLGDLPGHGPAVVLRMLNVILMGFTCALLAGETLSQVRARLTMAAAARAASEAEAKLEGIVRDAPIALLLCDASGRIERWNSAADALLRESRMPESLQEALARVEDGGRASLVRVLEDGGRVSALVRMRLQGAVREVQVDLSASREPDGKVTGVVAAFHDLTAGSARETERQRARMKAEESERRRISHELQEEVAQILTGVRLALGLVARSPELRGRHIEQAREHVTRLVTRVRYLSRDLRPSVLDDLGLVPGLRSLAQRVRERTGLVVEVRSAGSVARRFGAELETAAFRIVQEAIENAARHSGANTVSVAAWADEQSLFLSIDDEGRGFDVGAVAHGGLSAMRDRAEILGGSFEVDSAPGEGVRISVALPIGGSA